MLDWFVILTPLLLLGVVALLGFVGCDRVLGLNDVVLSYELLTIEPNVGPSLGGTPVKLSGVNLSNSSRVTFGGIDALFRVVSDSEIDAITPPNPVGAVDVFALQPDGTETTPAKVGDPIASFTYVAIGFAQMQANLSAAATSISVTLNGTTAGNILIAAVSNAGGTAAVKDNSGNAFTSVGKQAWFQGQAELFFLPSIPGGNATITASNLTGQCNICVSEYTGGSSLGALSANKSPNTGTVPEDINGVAVAPAPGNAAYVVVFAAQGGATPNLSAGPGFAGHSTSQDLAVLAEDSMTAVSGGQVVATANQASFVPWVVLAAEIQT